jgi:hypothetical protein
MAVFDMEMTPRWIVSYHCREVNPLMPSSHMGQGQLRILWLAAQG